MKSLDELKSDRGLQASRAAKQRLYNSKHWRRLRRQVLHDSPLCVHCQQAGRSVPACVVDHRIPHHGSLKLFWNIDNLQPLCRMHHNQKSAAERG